MTPSSPGKNLRKRSKRKIAKAAAKEAARLKAIEDKQVVTSASGAATVSAETRGLAAPSKVKLVQGGLPSSGKGGD